jgi:hypothetical protein
MFPVFDQFELVECESECHSCFIPCSLHLKVITDNLLYMSKEL